MSNFYAATNLIGGGFGALDNIDGAGLADGDGVVVITDNFVYFYYLNATSGETESPPQIISPDSNAGDKRWILNNLYGSAATITNIDSAAADWVVGDFICNGIWHDLDISDQVPVTCTEAWFKVFLSDDVIDRVFGFRKDGFSNTNAGFFIKNRVAAKSDTVILGPISVINQTVEYYATNAIITQIDVTLLAYREG